MRDGKQIVFTKHAKERSFQRGLGHYLLLMERFKTALRYAESFWVAFYYDDDMVTYVVQERKDSFVIITVY